jgi:replicative DNA helicase
VRTVAELLSSTSPREREWAKWYLEVFAGQEAGEPPSQQAEAFWQHVADDALHLKEAGGNAQRAEALAMGRIRVRFSIGTELQKRGRATEANQLFDVAERRTTGSMYPLHQLLYSAPEDQDQATDEAEPPVADKSEHHTASTMFPLHQLLGVGLDRIEELGHLGTPISGVPTGYHELDRILLGLQPSTLNIVGARPGMGKTSFALGILAHVGMAVQRPAVLFSLDMGRLELTQRILASEAGVNGQHLQTGRIRTQDWPKIGAAVTRLASAPIFIDDDPFMGLADISDKARLVKKEEGDLGLVVVDSLQLMSGRGRAENRQTEVAEITRGLKLLARELEVPVILLSQLSRNIESRLDKMPQLHDLRESGSLEQDADVVIFIYRESEYNDEIPIDRADDALIDVAKHRNGPTGKANLLFLKSYPRFENHRPL